ncbi:MAG: hypothetical protein H7829_17190 [Magnetococcus sp. THC-1_WYH]
MARDGNGTWNKPIADFVAATVISETDMNTLIDDVGSTLTASIAKDGQTTPTANLPMGGYAHTGVGAATVRTQYPTVAQLVDGLLTHVATDTGGANAHIISPTIAITSYVSGQRFSFIPAGTNTTNTTIVVSGLAQKAILRPDGSQLSANDITSGKLAVVEYNGTAFYLLSPRFPTKTTVDIGALSATDGNVIVGNGTTWVAESGATARTSLGAYGSGDSPTFATITTTSITSSTTTGRACTFTYTGEASGPAAFDCSNPIYVGVNLGVSASGRGNSSAYWYAYLANTDGTSFSFRGDGQAYADGSWNGGGADFAEYFEWSDGNPNGEDRIGYPVVIDGGKIRVALSGEDPIGAITGRASMVGDSAGLKWSGKFARDQYGRALEEPCTIYRWTGSNGEKCSKIVGPEDNIEGIPPTAIKTESKRWKLNPAYDNTKIYRPRRDRQEWAMVGLLGKVLVRSGKPVGDRWVKMRDVTSEVVEYLIR